MEIHLLDVGTREYGDCIIVHNAHKRILIDGAHKGDSVLLKKQMKEIFQQESPFHFDLLVLTHLHDDHIGCLPELVKNGDISAGKCLLMNPDFRWKKDAQDNAGVNDAFVNALLEEDHSFLPDAELQQFLVDAGELVVRYKDMITRLKQNSEVMIFNGVDAADYSALENEFSSLGLKILGPTKKHLKTTKDALLGLVDTLTDFVGSRSFMDAPTDPITRYRKIFSGSATDSQLVMDAAKNKGSINNESIILKFKSKNPAGWSALLTGDMQFAVPEVAGLEGEMEKLLTQVNDKGPYDFIKTSHHTSYNGLNEEMLDHWIGQGTEFFGHSGGLYDASHPEPGVLEALKDREEKIQFVRTDRNGLIKVANDAQHELSMWISKGEVNTFTKNRDKPRNNDVAAPEEIQNEKKPPAEKGIGGLFKLADGSTLQLAAVIPENRSVRIIIEVDGEKKN